MLALVIAVGPLRAAAQNQTDLQGANPPANAVWVDSLDPDKVLANRPPRPGQSALGGRGGRAGAPPPAPVPIVLGGVTYQHGLGVMSNGELWVDLKQQAKQFLAVVGIDDARKTGRGSVTFEVWVDGRKRFDSGIIKSGDPAVPVLVDLAGARQMILALVMAATVRSMMLRIGEVQQSRWPSGDGRNCADDRRYAGHRCITHRRSPYQ